MIVKQIRLSVQDKEKLSRLKGRTGIQNWNVLCRWALWAVSAAAAAWVLADGGENYKLYEALIRARCIRDGLGTDDTTLAKYFNLHLSRGIAYLSGTNYIRSLEDLLGLALKAEEEENGSVSGL